MCMWTMCILSKDIMSLLYSDYTMTRNGVILIYIDYEKLTLKYSALFNSPYSSCKSDLSLDSEHFSLLKA